MRVPLILNLLVPASITLGACGEDKRVITDLNGDTANGEVTGEVDWTVSFSAPSAGVLVGQEDEVNVTLALSSQNMQDWTTFEVTLKLNDDAVVSAGRFDADGRFDHLLTDLAGGAATLTAIVTEPGVGTQELSLAFSVNIPPAAPSVVITPSNPVTGDGLVAEVTPPEDATIKDGGALSTSYRWVKVGADPAIDIRTSTLSADLTEKGDTFEVYVTVNDGFADSPEAKASITIGNTAPVCNSVLLTPAAARVTQDLTCTCSDLDDVDGDDATVSCTFVDTGSGRELGTPGSCTLPAGSFEDGMTIACTVTPNDGDNDGASVTNPESANVLVLNSPPNMPTASISPSAGNALTEFTCEKTAGGDDPDGDSVTTTVAWQVGGEVSDTNLTTVTAMDLGATKGDALCCTITSSDGLGKSTSSPACVTLENAAPPEITVGLISDEFPPTRRSTLTCDTKDAFDPDGVALIISYAWYADGNLIPGENGANFSAANTPAGTIISCTATICDDENACAGPIASKASLKLQNALPHLDDALIVTDDGQANAGEVLVCEVYGWEDPDGEPQDVTYEWIVTDGSSSYPIDGENGETLVFTDAVPVGATITCRATPMNGDVAGTPVSSDPVTVGNPIPKPAVVAVEAPNGAEAAVTCKIVEPEQYIPAGVTRAFVWSVNGNIETSLTTQVLTAAQVRNCDLVKCTITYKSATIDLSSNTASAALPMGSDCEDDNVCTDSICLQGGGCGEIKLTAAINCDDGNACTENESCKEGVCVGEDVCVEDRLSVGTYSTNGRIKLEANNADGFAAFFDGKIRRTDSESTRIDEELSLSTLGQGGESPSGQVGIHIANGSTMPVGGNCTNNNGAFIYFATRIYAPDLATFTTLPNNLYSLCAGDYPRGANVLAMDDESFAIVSSYHRYPLNTALPLQKNPRLTFQRIESNLNKGAEIDIVQNIYLGPSTQITTGETMNRWDAKVVPDGTNSFMVTWLDVSAKKVFVQRFNSLGVAEFSPVEVASTAQFFETTSVVALPNGRFIVAWGGTGVDASGQGVAARRYDENGTPLGDAFVVNEVATGDQIVGDITACSDTSFAIGWYDTATPTARIMARIFGGTGVGTPGFVVNEKGPVSSLIPALTTLSNDDFVVAWRDTSNVLWTRRFDKTGKPSDGAPEFRANDEGTNMQQTPAAAATKSGNIMVAFASKVYPGTKATEIRTRVFEADGYALDTEEFANISDDGAQATPVVAAGDDRFVVAWSSELQDGSLEGIYAREYDEFGNPLTEEEMLVNVTTDNSQTQPAVSMAGDGSWVAVWTNFSAATSNDVKARVFPVGASASAEITISGVPLSQDSPAVAVVPGKSEFLVTWQGQTAINGRDIFVRRYGFDGTPKSAEFQVNTTVTNDQRNPTIAAIANDFFTICWESVSQHVATKSAVVCQRFKTSTMVPQSLEYKAFPWAEDQLNPHITYQDDGKLAIAFQAKSLDSEGAAIHVLRVNELGQPVHRFVANRYWASEQTMPWVVSNFSSLVVGWQSNAQDGSEGGIYFRILEQ
jgi:hypothetical protein